MTCLFRPKECLFCCCIFCYLQNIFLLPFQFFAGCSASGCKNSQFEVEDRNTKNATCCDLCMQGFYMQEECTSMISTKCTKCPVGTFMDKWNYAHSCTKCQQPCHSGKVAFTNCSDTSDRTCRCPSGKYWNLGLVRCEVCTRCKEGQRIKSYCSEEHDSVCEECPSVRVNSTLEHTKLEARLPIVLKI